MSVAQITSAELASCVAFMERHTRDAMFPLANLADHGLAGPDNDAPRAMSFFVLREQAEIAAILGQSNEGALFPVFGQMPPQACDVFLPVLRTPVSGVVGPEAQTRALLGKLDIRLPIKLDADEPQLFRGLASLDPPDDPAFHLSPITPELMETAIDWRTEYIVTLLCEPADKARDVATSQIAKFIDQDSHRLLLKEGAPVSMTGFNARYKGHVQIGGVYTPPALRRHGYASMAIALHLAQARLAGAGFATLFAASDAAASVYRRIGFEDCGRYSLVLFEPEGPAA